MSMSNSLVLYIGGLPYNWSQDNLGSILKGSGRVVDIRLKLDPQGKNKGFCFVEYFTAEEARRAMELLSEVRYGGRKKLRIELSKEGLRYNSNAQSQRPLLELSREFLPSDVQLPLLMTMDDDNSNNSSNNNSRGRNPNNNTNQSIELMPEYLLQAAANLPPLNKLCLNADSKVSQNLEPIPPSQIIQIIATLKNFLINNDRASVNSVLGFSPKLTIAVAQALLLMGFVDNEVITLAATSNPSNNSNDQNFQQTKNAMPPPPQQQQFQQPPQQYGNNNNNNGLQQYNNNNQRNFQNPPQMNNYQNNNPTNNNNLLQTSNQNQSPPIPPQWNSLPQSAIRKLLLLDRAQADMIAQVLSLPPVQISNLPADQKAAIDQIRSQYLW